MRFTQIPANTFKELQLNAGILTSNFAPTTGTVESNMMLGATSGGISFTATPTYTDLGDDIDNCPKNMMELKKLESWEVKMSGTFLTVNTAQAKSLMAAADIGSSDTTKITPRNDVAIKDFDDIWWIGDYSDKNGATNGGYIAIHTLVRPVAFSSRAATRRRDSLRSSTLRIILWTHLTPYLLNYILRLARRRHKDEAFRI